MGSKPIEMLQETILLHTVGIRAQLLLFLVHWLIQSPEAILGMRSFRSFLPILCVTGYYYHYPKLPVQTARLPPSLPSLPLLSLHFPYLSLSLSLSRSLCVSPQALSRPPSLLLFVPPSLPASRSILLQFRVIIRGHLGL